MKIELTANEVAVLKSLANNYYGDGQGGVWSWAVNDSDTPSGIEGKALSGVVGSLAKKGVVYSEKYSPKEDVIWFKPVALELIKELGLYE